MDISLLLLLMYPPIEAPFFTLLCISTDYLRHELFIRDLTQLNLVTYDREREGIVETTFESKTSRGTGGRVVL